MSESENREQQSDLCNDENGDDDEEEEDKKKQDEDGDNCCIGAGVENVVEERRRRREVSRKGVFGTSRDFRDAIKRSFGRRKKRRKEMEKETADTETKRSSSSSFHGRGGGGCYVCFMQPRTDECPETPTSDPNSENFSYEMLRTLIETNDFYCKESNPHI